jgi:aminoglycoside phosphotransferase (APT) family kinase protein
VSRTTLERASTPAGWMALRAEAETVEGLVREAFAQCGISSGAAWSQVHQGSCLNIVGRDFFLKFFSPHEDEVRTRELLGLEAFADRLPGPKLLHVGRSDGIAFAVMSRMEGVPLDRAWDELSNATRCDVLRTLGSLIAATSRLAPPPWPLPDASQWWRRNKNDPAVTQLRPELVDEALGDEPPECRTLVHADIKREHLLVTTDGQLSGVVDFGDCELAWPAYELVTIYAEVCRFDPMLVYALEDGYGQRIDMSEVVRASVAHRFHYLAHFQERAKLASSVRELVASLESVET